MFMPVMVPYGQICDTAQKSGFQVDNNFEGLMEKGAMFGRGWIATKLTGEIKSDDSRVFEIQGEFNSYEHVGPYQELGKAYSMIMKDFPGSKEFYSIYLNNPSEVAKNELRTRICFR